MNHTVKGMMRVAGKGLCLSAFHCSLYSFLSFFSLTHTHTHTNPKTLFLPTHLQWILLTLQPGQLYKVHSFSLISDSLKTLYKHNANTQKQLRVHVQLLVIDLGANPFSCTVWQCAAQSLSITQPWCKLISFGAVLCNCSLSRRE